MDSNLQTYYHENLLEQEDTNGNGVVRGAWRRRYCGAFEKHRKIGSNNYPVRASTLRDAIADYFMVKYPLHWQQKYVQGASYNPVVERSQ